MHYTLLIACVLVAFFLGAILSGFLVSCYCSRSAAQHTQKLSKDPEASLSHALSLRSLARLSGLLDTQSKVGVSEESERLHPPGNPSSRFLSLLQEDKLDVSSPKMYSSFIPNGLAEPHVRSNGLHGLVAADGELDLPQVSRHIETHHQRSSDPTSGSNNRGGTFDASVTPLVFSSLTG